MCHSVHLFLCNMLQFFFYVPRSPEIPQRRSWGADIFRRTAFLVLRNCRCYTAQYNRPVIFGTHTFALPFAFARMPMTIITHNTAQGVRISIQQPHSTNKSAKKKEE